MSNIWNTIIGLEVHIQLNTKSKLFSGAPNKFGGTANSQTSLIDLGYPGTLPVINEEAITMAIKLGIALNGNIPEQTVFARKNYFYPDLPKGYQISQFDKPIISGGFLLIETGDQEKKINLTRAHLEEDAGKSIHIPNQRLTGLDLNRAGTPLIEVVSEPEMKDAQEAVSFMKNLRELVRHLEICDGNMQEGSFRCDANISVKRNTDNKLGTKVEIKNLNSFKFVENAINFEISRQINRLENKEKIIQETRLYDEKTGETKTMRTKEDENDYRYFPDPDLLPVEIDINKLNLIKNTAIELPLNKRKRYATELGLNQTQIDTLLADPALTSFFEKSIANAALPPKLAANWITGEIMKYLKEANITISQIKIDVKSFIKILKLIETNECTQNDGKRILQMIWEDEILIEEAINKTLSGKEKFNDENLSKIVNKVLDDHSKQVEQYLAGKKKVFGFLVGQVMNLSSGKADPKRVNRLIKDRLNQ
mgnify:CR=1 FL=1